MKKAIRNLTLTLAGALLFVPFAQGAVSTAQNKDGLTSLEKGVRHELVMLPWFGVFDNLEFQVNGDEVVLSGHVTRPTLKTDAGRVVSRIEGVDQSREQHRSAAAIVVRQPNPTGDVSIDLRLRRTVPLQLGSGAADPHHREERECDVGWRRRE